MLYVAVGCALHSQVPFSSFRLAGYWPAGLAGWLAGDRQLLLPPSHAVLCWMYTGPRYLGT